jgi:hypothetical protein
MNRLLLTSGAFAFLAALAAPRPEARSAPAPLPRGGHATPQAVFEAARKARGAGDHKGLHDCLSPDASEALAGQLICIGCITAGFASLDNTGKLNAQLGALGPVLTRHGVTQKDVAKASRDGPLPNGNGNPGPKELASLLKDRRGFVVEMLAAMAKHHDLKGLVLVGHRLENVRINGDKASAKVY